MSKHYAGARIHALRKSRGLTQVAMAKELDLSTSYLNQLENDQRPLTVTVLMQLTQRFGVDPTYFSPVKDVRTISDLRAIFPQAPESTLSEIAARYPELMPELVDIARRVPDSRPAGSYEVVRDFFYDANNYIHELDVLAEELSDRLGDSLFRLTQLSTLLDRELGVQVRFRAAGPHLRRHYDPETRQLDLQDGLTDAQLCFQMALQYCLLAYRNVMDNLVSELADADSRDLATYGLAQYFAAAVTMPYTAFLEQAEDFRYDVERLGTAFGTSFEATAQRLATLQRPGAQGVPFFFIRTDRAGNISKRQSATSFHFSRSGGSCPLWVVHRAFETPNRITRQVATMPDGHSYLWIARHIQGQVQPFGTPRKEFSVGLGCDISQAHRLIYSDALNLNPAAATPIGPGCTTCPRSACPQRAFPQSGVEAHHDLNASPNGLRI
ncbi:short-chain fatty acyl-CoA regulator family protein [Corynebacterium confusum]